MSEEKIQNYLEELEEHEGEIVRWDGGMIANKFYVFRLEKVDKEENRLILKGNDGQITTGEYFKPKIHKGRVGSATLIREDLTDILDFGKYIITANTIVKDDVGVFGSIHDATPVAKFNEEKEKWEEHQ